MLLNNEQAISHLAADRCSIYFLWILCSALCYFLLVSCWLFYFYPDSEVSLVNRPENLIIFSQFSVPIKCINIPLLSWEVSSQWCEMSAKCAWRMNLGLKATTSSICMSGAPILGFHRPHCLFIWAELPQFVSEDVDGDRCGKPS